MGGNRPSFHLFSRKRVRSAVLLLAATLVLTVSGALVLRQAHLRSDRTKLTSQIGSLLLVCRAYAADWDGAYPPSLDALVPSYIDDPALLAWTTRDGKRLPFIYHPGLKNSSSPDLPLIESPVLIGNLKAIGYVGGQVRELASIPSP